MTRRWLHAVIPLIALAAIAPHEARAVPVVGTETVLNRVFGVDLHLDNCCDGRYDDLPTVIAQIKYIGARRLRDWASNDDDLAAWQTVHAATGDLFHASIPEASPEGQAAALARIGSWLKSSPGLIDVIEGGNEEDGPYALAHGALLFETAQMQPRVYAVGHAAGVQVAQLSVGAGWRPPLYEGHYKSFGMPPADLGNAHIYMNANIPPQMSLIRIGNLAAYSVPGKPVDVTEFGIYQKLNQSDDLTSAFMHEAPFDAFELGDAGLFVYALHDDESGVVSFYKHDGSKRDFANYWHVTTGLLADPNGKALPTKDVALTFSGQSAGTAPLGLRNLPMYKSDGSLWIAAYDEERQGAPDGSETIGLDKSYGSVTVIDGRTGQTVAAHSNTANVIVPLPANHVYFVVAR